MDMPSLHPMEPTVYEESAPSSRNWDEDMDVDMDIDLGPIHNDEPDQAQINPFSVTTVVADIQVPDQNLSSKQIVPSKVHIRGVDNLRTEDIIAYTSEYIRIEAPVKIEWIDDTSANIVFSSPDVAYQALHELSLGFAGGVVNQSLLQLREARPYSKNPEVRLHVRTAVSTDQKRPRAYEASKFYMMHPEYDPREKRHASRDKDGSQSNRRKRRGVLEYSADMYDDDSSAIARQSGGSTDDGERTGRRRGSNGGLGSRNRSASPGNDADNTDNHQRRRRTPPPKYRERDPYPFPRENSGKELFPSKSVSALSGKAESDRPVQPPQAKELFPPKRAIKELFPAKTAGKELFPGKTRPTLKKELFPPKSGTTVHRRSDAFDAADGTEERFGNGLSPTGPLGKGRLNSISSDIGVGFSIRGAAKQQDQGFSIRGMANTDGASDGFVKELFPNRVPANSGKELFAEKLQGRGGRRNRAVDVFY
ncbi:MAG: hypothetical protein MMC33_002478 [Icmadophila ericetorum]|nr:hypothetical protein [Icmadophila ericetorum]